MKTSRLILALLALTFALAPQPISTASASQKKGYKAKLISPKAGDVLVPGQVVRIEWTATFPDVDLTMCETEIRLSLDGGATTYMWITGFRDPSVRYYDWTVPNVPTRTAVLDIHFGCLGIFPETPSPQTQATFTIVGLD
ncbi:MAG: hypothetical protein DMF06_13340 [Verrucomicrobia bacterium]|nr:MAG: hypothetical protein DMF06_13340 [Verrucomicrobiota bacterium]